MSFVPCPLLLKSLSVLRPSLYLLQSSAFSNQFAAGFGSDVGPDDHLNMHPERRDDDGGVNFRGVNVPTINKDSR